MLPDPSIAPLAVWVTGLAGDPLSALQGLLAAIAVGFAVCAMLLAGVLVSVGLRR